MPPMSGPIAATTLELRIVPGATALTRTCDSANSAAQVRVNDSSADLVAPWTAMPGVPRPAAVELMLTMLPPQPAAILSANSAVSRNGARTLTAKAAS
ncbi:hypothetical protein GCM10010515_72110 [Streptomyces fructofermentans]|uniref:Uncharacterized protein n=1 Tax=Streptomyces fructofermentans TaxID=152141 RepID=A0A918U5T8_9ACTN|nr:hypothetical protein GCM10010515_72110 [Streptomyces fructofermentans]